MVLETFKFKTGFLGKVMLLSLIISLSACDNNEDEMTPNISGQVSLSSNPDLGDFLVDGDGRTLYLFARDVGGQSNCLEGNCLDNWPVFYSDNINPGEGLNASDFGTLTRSDGEMQTTYQGWPLYYYVGDSESGDINGEAVGNIWFVAKPDYSIMIGMGQLVGHDGKNYTGDYVEGEAETMYFTDSQGNTLYIFINDYKNDNNFTNADFSNNEIWPVFYTDIESLPSILSEDDFGEIDVFGNMQLTYKGWPLYYFGQDGERGETKGVSFPVAGIWPIVNTSTVEAPPAPTVVISEDETFGQILTDIDGRSLYYFSNDVDGNSSCEGGCLNFWPRLLASEIILDESSELNTENFGLITLEGSSDQQVTYKGWPLYYYSPTGDGEIENAGETAGDGFNNVWFVAKPDYSLMIGNGQLLGADGVNYTSDYSEGEGNTVYFTDINGRTLYIFINDEQNTNNFTSEDFSNNDTWPIFHVDINTLPSGMNIDHFGEIDVFGEPQLTFKGWPLYYFGSDESRGDTKGVSVPSPGVWPIVNNELSPAP